MNQRRRGAPTTKQVSKRLVALAGNPNSGKTTVFNALTGLRQKVGNYAGVTVEKKLGLLTLPDGTTIEILDLPGAYSLTARSPEEQIARNVLLGEVPDTPRPDLVVLVVDGSNLERNLYLATQVLDMGLPAIIALNMMDVAQGRGLQVDAAQLERWLGVPVVPLIASKGVGIDRLKELIARSELPRPPARRWKAAPEVEEAIQTVAQALRRTGTVPEEAVEAEAIRLIGLEGTPSLLQERGGPELVQAVRQARERLQAAGHSPATFEAEARYEWIRSLTREVVRRSGPPPVTLSDRVDQVLTHRVFGPIAFIALMALVFQTVFTWATIPADWIDAAMVALGDWIRNLMPPGAFRSLLADGVIGGVGSVLVFLPQILALFFFISLMEDTGYMARVAFMMDRIMRRVGLHGKAFVPLLSSFACAVPGIMATRTIENPRDRLVTIMAAPLITCSARLPIYTLLIAAFIPGGATVKALTMLSLYLMGIVGSITVAFVLKKTLLKGETPPLVLELPAYKWPSWKAVLLTMWDRSRHFLRRAGTIILGVAILLWFLTSYPSPPESVLAPIEARRAELLRQNPSDPAVAQALAELDNQEASLNIQYSFAGYFGRAIEPALRPLGFDWRIGIGIFSSFAAREVFVSTMGTIYSVGAVDEETTPLIERLQSATWQSGPLQGQPIFTLPTAVALLVFYVFALQCMSTVVTMARETGSWKWPAFAWTYMAAMAYVGAFLARHLVLWLA
ncbi:MAG: ferrous iron transport protein B [Candidatus Poribacteria bacterium]|nr:MAG: ferrous iron transport protein B [Candidatus Poribacteria bacterium]